MSPVLLKANLNDFRRKIYELQVSVWTILLSNCHHVRLRFSELAGIFYGNAVESAASEGAGFVPMQQLAKHPDLPFTKALSNKGITMTITGLFT